MKGPHEKLIIVEVIWGWLPMLHVKVQKNLRSIHTPIKRNPFFSLQELDAKKIRQIMF